MWSYAGSFCAFSQYNLWFAEVAGSQPVTNFKQKKNALADSDDQKEVDGAKRSPAPPFDRAKADYAVHGLTSNIILGINARNSFLSDVNWINPSFTDVWRIASSLMVILQALAPLLLNKPIGANWSALSHSLFPQAHQ